MRKDINYIKDNIVDHKFDYDVISTEGNWQEKRIKGAWIFFKDGAEVYLIKDEIDLILGHDK